MKRIAAILLSVATLLVGQKGFTNECYEPCYNECSACSFDVYADYLYWTVTRPVLFILNLDGAFSLAPRYNSGFRVGSAFSYHCIDLDACYTRILPRERVHDPFAPTGILETLSYKLDFNVVDLAFGYTHPIECYRAFVRPYLGAKLAWLDEKAILFDANADVPRSTNVLATRAYGPMLGVEGSWEILHCWIPISLIAQGDVSLVYANSCLVLPGAVVRDRFYSTITVTDLYVALGFDFGFFSCVDADLQVGYEVQTWSHVRGLIASVNTTTSMNLSGLVVRLGAQF